jgi:polysaccharide biosynthesis protein PslG
MGMMKRIGARLHSGRILAGTVILALVAAGLALGATGNSPAGVRSAPPSSAAIRPLKLGPDDGTAGPRTPPSSTTTTTATGSVAPSSTTTSVASAAAKLQAHATTVTPTTSVTHSTTPTHPATVTQATPVPASTTTTTTAKPPGTSAAPQVAATGPVFGISVPDLIEQTPAVQAAWLANIKSLGLTSVRIGADWAWIQYGGPTSYDWSDLDQEVAAIRAAGLSIDMVIIGAPPWAAVSSVADDSSPQPADPATFGTFAAAVAARYAPEGVQDYEIWNEPNNAIFWQPAPNPAVYTAVLAASYQDIKAVDPSAVVITGGLAPEANDGTDINQVTFLQDMYADGAKGSFNAVGYHPYSYPALPDTYEIWSGWSQMSQTPTSIESVMAANGNASVPLWLTEVGAPTNGPDGVGTAAQAEDLTQAIANAKTTSSIAALYIYTYEDSGTDTSTDEDWFGLLTASGAENPSYAAVAAALK